MIYLPPEIWIKIFKIYDEIRIERKKREFQEIHLFFNFQSHITFLDYMYSYEDFNSYWTPVSEEYKKFDSLDYIDRIGCKYHRYHCNCLLNLSASA